MQNRHALEAILSGTVVDVGVWQTGKEPWLRRHIGRRSEVQTPDDCLEELLEPHLKPKTNYRVRVVVEEVRDGE